MIVAERSSISSRGIRDLPYGEGQMADLSAANPPPGTAIATDVIGLALSAVVLFTTDVPLFRFVAGAGGLWMFMSLISEIGQVKAQSA